MEPIGDYDDYNEMGAMKEKYSASAQNGRVENTAGSSRSRSDSNKMDAEAASMPPPPSRRPHLQLQPLPIYTATSQSRSSGKSAFEEYPKNNARAETPSPDGGRRRSLSSSARLSGNNFQAVFSWQLGTPRDKQREIYRQRSVEYETGDIMSTEEMDIDQLAPSRADRSDSEDYATIQSPEVLKPPVASVRKPEPAKRLFSQNTKNRPVLSTPSPSPPKSTDGTLNYRRYSMPGMRDSPIEAELYTPRSHHARMNAEYTQRNQFLRYDDLEFDDPRARARWARMNEMMQAQAAVKLEPLHLLAEEYKKSEQKKIDQVKEDAKKLAAENALKLEKEQREARRKEADAERARLEALLPAGAPPLSSEEEELYQDALCRRDNDIIADKYNIEVKGEHIRRMLPGGWLNDELINFYMELLSDRSKKDPSLPRCHFFNSFFYKLLSKEGAGYDFARVQSWTRRVDIFQLDKVIAPIHMGNHWCLAVINIKEKRFEYYDSMGGRNPECIERLQRYINDEHKAKKKTEIDISSWDVYTPGDQVPQQHNPFDCGVFACRFADCVAADRSFRFHQRHMPTFRKSMVLEVLNGALRIHSQNGAS